jgi:uncharacterized protein (DUF1501 family)
VAPDHLRRTALLGLTAGLILSLVLMGVIAVYGRDIPNSLAMLAGVCAGGLSGFLAQPNGGSH